MKMVETNCRDAVIERIVALGNEYNEKNWDDYGAKPITVESVASAIQFVRCLPDDIPMPTCAPEPDGAVSLDWIVSVDRLISVSVLGNGRTAYACLDKMSSLCVSGVAPFNGTHISPHILKKIRGVMKGAK